MQLWLHCGCIVLCTVSVVFVIWGLIGWLDNIEYPKIIKNTSNEIGLLVFLIKGLYMGLLVSFLVGVKSISFVKIDTNGGCIKSIDNDTRNDDTRFIGEK